MTTRSQVSLHRFAAPRALALPQSPVPGGSFGMGAAVLCSVNKTADGLTVDYGRAADAKAQLQAMVAAVARVTSAETLCGTEALLEQPPVGPSSSTPGDLNFVPRAN
jgi:hypothetical protein